MFINKRQGFVKSLIVIPYKLLFWVESPESDCILKGEAQKTILQDTLLRLIMGLLHGHGDFKYISS